MKKLFLVGFIILFSSNIAQASALTEDYVDIASSFAREGEYNQSMTYINKALMIEPQNTELIDMKNSLLKILGQKVSGMKQSEIFQYNEAYLDAVNACNDRNYSKAISLYKKSLKEKPNFTSAYLGQAIANYELKNFQEAKRNLDIYLEKEPQSDIAYLLRAKTNMNLGEPQSALRDIKSAQVYSCNIENKLIEAVILTEMGKYQQARDILLPISEDIQLYIVFKYLGICDYKLGNYSSATLNFSRAIILFEDDKTILPMYNDAKRKCNEG